MTANRRWFFTLARAEGLSMVLLLGVAMPLKYLAGILEPVAWVGWIHGILFLIYLVALGSIYRLEGWTWKLLLLGALASVVPLGTFAFEAWLHRNSIR